MPVVNPGIRRQVAGAITRLFNSASFDAPLTHSLVPTRGTGSPTFTRATTATVMGYGPTDNAVDGLKLLTVAANEARFVGARRISEGVWSNTFADGSLIPAATNTGYLAEGARTNLWTYSQDYDNAAWTKTSITVVANDAVAPDGTTTADKLTNDNTSSVLDRTAIVTANTTYTDSVYIKYGNNTWARILYGTGYDAVQLWVNLQTGVIGTVTASGGTAVISAYSIEPSAKGFWRVKTTVNLGGAITEFQHRVYLVNADNSGTIVADAYAHHWGAQLELGSFASSYIPTTTVAVQRNADVLTYPSAGNISTVTGWAYAEVTSNTVAGQQMDMIDLVASGNPFIPMLVNAGNNFALLDPSVSTRAFNAAPTRPIATPVKFSSTWSASGTIGTFNGAAPPASQSYTTGAVTNPICVGIRADGSQSIFGTIRNVRISQRQLSASEQQAITS